MGIHFLFSKALLILRWLSSLQCYNWISYHLYLFYFIFFKGRVSLGTVDHHGTTHITQVGGKLVAVLLFPVSHVLRLQS